MRISIWTKVVAVGVALALILGVILFFCFNVRIPNGYVGVVYSPSGGVKEQVLTQGWHRIGFFEKVTKRPTRMKTVNYKDIEISTADGKRISSDFAFTYLIDQSKVVPLFNQFGPVTMESIEEDYLRTRFWDAARRGVSKFTVIDIYGEKSSEAAVAIQEIFSRDVAQFGFTVANLTVGVPKPDESTQTAIDLRVSAAQELERKTTELEIARQEAERKRVEAQGQADANLIEAEGQAKANAILKQSLTPELIQMEIAKRWNGTLPQVTSDNTPLISLPVK